MGSAPTPHTTTPGDAEHVAAGPDGVVRRAVVVTGGGPLAAAAVADLRLAPHDHCHAHSYVVAADSGLDHALAAGLRPDLLVGDLDSISAAGLAWAEANCAIERHDPDKSATDTELAIAAVFGATNDRPAPVELVLIAGDGDRLDHLLATIGAGARAAADRPDVAVDAWIGTTQLHFVTPGRARALALPADTTFSALALDGAAAGVCITGARWPLTDATLAALSGLGVSNVATATPVTVTLTAGVVAVVVPADGAGTVADGGTRSPSAATLPQALASVADVVTAPAPALHPTTTSGGPR